MKLFKINIFQKTFYVSIQKILYHFINMFWNEDSFYIKMNPLIVYTNLWINGALKLNALKILNYLCFDVLYYCYI